ncbi:MAG: TIGR04086 family membrane protein [Clostridia bacterium]|nr:TIGR04086 family membrane protein [Clostridia bacterium]
MPKKSDINFLKEIVKGNVLGSLMLFVFLLISSVSILKLNFSEKSYLPLYLGSLIFSCGISSMITVCKLHRKGLIYGIEVSLLPSVISIVLTCVASGSFSLIYLLIPLISVVSAAVGGVAAVNIKFKKRRRK